MLNAMAKPLTLIMLLASALPCPALESPAASKTDERPRLTLLRGEHYFREDGRATFLLGRNPAASSPAGFEEHFRHIATAGERLVRIHFTYIPPGEKPGEIDEGMLKSWDAILDAAEKNSLAVLPVLGVWSNWNDGSGTEAWHTWDKNPYNAERGGPAKKPSELFDDTPCRRLWLKRVETFVRRWGHRRAIVGWEVFSELDLVTGATEAPASAFAQCAADVVRAADPYKRPVTASQAGVDEWPTLLKSDALDFIEIHPYSGGAYGGRLDDLILSTTRQRLGKYGKPVMLGECGLNAAAPHGTLETAARADVGIRHAIWASIVSGAMNGRMLWWEDGYDQFEKADLCSHYQKAAAPAAEFVRNVDFTGFAPVGCKLSEGLAGAIVGSNRLWLGWLRDARCQAPDWPMKPMSGQNVTMAAAGEAFDVEFIDPVSGKSTSWSRMMAQDKRLRIVLPEFQGSVAFRMKQVSR